MRAATGESEANDDEEEKKKKDDEDLRALLVDLASVYEATITQESKRVKERESHAGKETEKREEVEEKKKAVDEKVGEVTKQDEEKKEVSF